MNEDFVSFDLAKKLKDKGFNQPCLAHYTNGKFEYNIAYYDEVTLQDLYENWSNGAGCFVDTPTIAQVLKWLREEKKMNVNMRLLVENGWYFSIQDYMGVQRYSILQDAKDTDDLYSSYEEAAIAGITYCLDNLI